MFLKKLKKLDGYWWFIAGILFFLGTALSSIARSIAPMPAGDFVSLSIDWFAACIVYFFLGGLLGHAVDWWRLRKQITHPLWVWLTLALWIGGAIVLAIVAKPGLLPWYYVVMYPFIFGIFFVGAGFYTLFPAFVSTTAHGKVFLDCIVLCLFFFWLWKEYLGKQLSLRRVALLVLFALLFIGVCSCAQVIANTPVL